MNKILENDIIRKTNKNRLEYIQLFIEYEKKIEDIEKKGYKKLTNKEMKEILSCESIEIKDYYIELPIFLELEKGQKPIKIQKKEKEEYTYENKILTKTETKKLLSQIYIKQE